jgi:putative sterol carrier protein
MLCSLPTSKSINQVTEGKKEKGEGLMAFKFPSDEWVKDFQRQMNESEVYARAGKGFEGDWIFIVEPDDVLPEPIYFFMSLNNGKCTDATMIASEQEREAQYFIRAPFSTWRKVIEGKLDPIQGLMMRKLKLKGNLMKVMRYPKAAKEMMQCVMRVPTDFGS